MTTTGELADRARDQIGGELRNFVSALGDRAVQVVTDRIVDVTGRLGEYAKRDGDPGLVATATGAQKLAEGTSPVKAMVHAGLAGGREKLRSAFRGRRSRSGARTSRVNDIVETVEVGVPVGVAYRQWRAFDGFPSLMATDDADETVVRQIPDRLVHWRSTGDRGAVHGTVSFHEVGPELTRILVVLAHHPQGFLEHTAGLWRAHGRRVRLELDHFVRHVMTRAVLDPDTLAGWRGEIAAAGAEPGHEAAQPPRPDAPGGGA
ncbi:SRPBCC family protein [Micromonospora sp. DT31]|uniref:SRPBCC family protein n=1 Tax=Micromonospora sp. DT31 TaxID=3393434 RepID=UPI003CF0EB4F